VNSATPPRWAEAVLRVMLPPRDGPAVSGDLLEEYRERIYPERGQLRADLWYVLQVGAFAWRGNRVYAALLSGQLVLRNAIDWFLPTIDRFHARLAILTFSVAAAFFFAGFAGAARSRGSNWQARFRRLRAGALAGVMTALIGAAMTIAGTVVLLAIWHDAQTMAAIQASGGTSEMFTLPALLALPGALLGALGGLSLSRVWLTSARRAPKKIV
jgi:hypothetical protein